MAPVGGSAINSATGFQLQTLKIGAGGTISYISVYADGTKLCRADAFGAYKYDGTLWQQLLTSAKMPAIMQTVGVGATGVYEIVAAPSNTSILFMAYFNLLFKSTDGGGSFAQLTGFTTQEMDGFGNQSRVYGPKMAVDPANSSVAYLTTDTAGVFVTVNGGTTWASVSGIPGNDSDQIGLVLFDPNSGTTGGKTNTIYITASGHGVYRSTNAGGSFPLMSGSPATPVSIRLNSDSSIIFVADNGGVLKKFASGSWSDITPVSTGDVVCVPGAPNHVIAFSPFSGNGFAESTNAGASWPNINSQQTVIATDIPWLATQDLAGPSFVYVQLDPADNTTLWAGGIQGIATSSLPVQADPTPQVWTSKSRNIEELVADQIIVPQGFEPIAISWDAGVIRQPTTSLGSQAPTAYAAVQNFDTSQFIQRAYNADTNPSDPSFIVAFLDYPLGSAELGISTNGGVSWSKTAITPPAFGLGGCIACLSSTNFVRAQFNNGDAYYTTNAGGAWTKIINPGSAGVPQANGSNTPGWGFAYYLHRIIVAADRVNGKVYMQNAGPAAAGSFVSADGGATWTYHPNSIDLGFSSKLKCVPGQADNLFFTSGFHGSPGSEPPSSWPHADPLYRSTNGTTSWSAVANVLEVWDFGFGKAAPGQSYPAIYIFGWVSLDGGSTYNPGLWRSIDNCVSWQLLSAGLFPGDGWLDTIVTVSGDPNTYGTVYLGRSGSGYLIGNFP